MSKACNSASSKPGTWVRQASSSFHPPRDPRRANTGTPAALSASISRWMVRSETSSRSANSRPVSWPRLCNNRMVDSKRSDFIAAPGPEINSGIMTQRVIYEPVRCVCRGRKFIAARGRDYEADRVFPDRTRSGSCRNPSRHRARTGGPQRLEASRKVHAAGVPGGAGRDHARLDRNDDQHRGIGFQPPRSAPNPGNKNHARTAADLGRKSGEGAESSGRNHGRSPTEALEIPGWRAHSQRGAALQNDSNCGFQPPGAPPRSADGLSAADRGEGAGDLWTVSR